VVVFVVVLASLAFSQQLLRESSFVINIEVPVRVFKDGKFVDNLTIKDFEVLEDGKPQKVEAVYLIKKDMIQRKEEPSKKFRPQTERTFYLFFQLSEYEPKLNTAIDRFVTDVILPGDKLIAVTPAKTYRLKDRGLELKTKPEIAEELKSILRKDIVMGNSEYRTAVRELTAIVKEITAKIPTDGMNPALAKTGDEEFIFRGFGITELIYMYQTYLEKLEVLREVDELKLVDFAKYLKEHEGQKYVFFFYQREFIPRVDQRVLAQGSSMMQDVEGVNVQQMLVSVMEFNRRGVEVNVERIKRAYADSSTSVHFLFLSRPSRHVPGVYFAEDTSDIFTPFFEMAKASGGFAESSANPEYLFKRAVEASENYYLLYYSPKNYLNDGKFKEIKVRVKGSGYKVVHRLGYFAN
jgi:hypothetical protein